MTARSIFGVALGLVSAAAVVAGLAVVGSPAEARLKRLDERRVTDLQTLNNLLNQYWSRHKALPASLDEALNSAGWASSTRDPVTGELYPYRIVEGRRYELCATFDRASDQPPSTSAPFWSHSSGRQCFPMEIREGNR